jgi:hypothetical protein
MNDAGVDRFQQALCGQISLCDLADDPAAIKDQYPVTQMDEFRQFA